MQAQGSAVSEKTKAEGRVETAQGLGDWSSSNPFPVLPEICWKQPGVSGDAECSSCHPGGDLSGMATAQGAGLGSTSAPGQGGLDRGREGCRSLSIEAQLISLLALSLRGP